jgi:hypothetical protein
LLAACAAAVYGLLAIWFGVGRGHWFVRAAVVAAAIGMLVPVPAFDLAIVFLSQSLSVAVSLLLLGVIRSAKRRNVACELEITEPIPSGHRFTLVDLFLLTLVAAGAATLGAYLPTKHRDFWLSYVMIGAGAGIVTLAAAWAALGRRWPILRWAVLIAAAPAVGWLLRLAEVPEELSENLFGASALLGIPGAPAWFAPTTMSLTAALIAAPLVLLKHGGWLAFFSRRGLATFASGESERPWKRFLSRLGAVLVTGAASVVVGAAYFKMLCVLPIPRIEAPDPNGYLMLAKLGGELEHAGILTGDPLSETELREFVDANRTRLKAAHAALELPHVAPVDYQSPDLPHLEAIQGNRQLARAFVNEGKLAALEGRPDAAASSCLDAMQFGQVVSRGGLFIDALVGTAIEGIGSTALCEIRGSMSPATSRRLIDALQRLDHDREPVTAITAREAIWQQHAYGWAGRFFPDLSTAEGVTNIADARRAKLRLLIYDLAIRLYRADHGRLPERLEQLAPKHLRQLLDDPFTGRPPIYRSRGESYLLYSVGPDLDDDGGRAIADGVLYGDGDFVLDPPEAAAIEIPGE